LQSSNQCHGYSRRVYTCQGGRFARGHPRSTELQATGASPVEFRLPKHTRALRVEFTPIPRCWRRPDRYNLFVLHNHWPRHPAHSRPTADMGPDPRGALRQPRTADVPCGAGDQGRGISSASGIGDPGAVPANDTVRHRSTPPTDNIPGPYDWTKGKVCLENSEHAATPACLHTSGGSLRPWSPTEY
jgi:hypothetical protein